MSEIKVLRERLLRLSDAVLRINKSLALETVLQEVLDSALSLTGARYGVMLLHDDSGRIVDQVTSGLTAEQAEQFWVMPGGMDYQRHMEALNRPIRVRDMDAYAKEHGLPPLDTPYPVSAGAPVMSTPVLLDGKRLASIHVTERDDDNDGEFSADDEETLAMFASQAALAISNARHHHDERRARADLETLVNSVPIGVVVFDAETGLVTTANRELWRQIGENRLSGESVEELMSNVTLRRADGREVPAAGSELAEELKSAKPVVAEEVRIEAPDGVSAVVLVNATPIRDESGAVQSLVVTVQDLSQLEETDRLRAEFLGTIGHELRSPLAGIKGSTTTLLDAEASLDPAETAQYHRIIDEQADYMRDLIGDLIDVVRIETGTLSIAPQACDVSDLVDEARNMYLSGGGRANVRISVPPDLPPVLSDRKRIVQVINNLLSNAQRNSHEESPIRLSVAAEDTHVSVSVADSGVGLPAEGLSRAFNKFARATGPGHSRDLGLGLAICKGVVEAHGGRIWAESDGPGLGARFTFTVPISEDSPSVVAARSRARKGNDEHDSSTRVLVIDDDPRMLKLVRDALTDARCDPTVTADPERVADLMIEVDPHVVLLDLMLPGSGGIELMPDILAGGDVPVIFLSAYDQEELIAKAFEMGAIDYIVKPFSRTELVARVRAALRKKADPPGPFTLGDLQINYSERAVTVAGESVELTPTEYRLLTELSTNAGAVLTYDQLLQRVWGPGRGSDIRPMRTVVKNLRRKLGEDAHNLRYVLTVSRIGYRMPKPSDAPS